MNFRRLAISLSSVIVTLFFLAPAALADNWEAVKLRGGVFALVDGDWQQLERGSVVSDSRIVRTAQRSRVQFQRGNETIDLGPDTQVRIFDRSGEKFTIVQQHFGQVEIEADKREVQHFAVQTQFLAAVVKGTRFSVTADARGANVDVSRGQVQVRDVARKLLVEVTPGQSASVSSTETLAVQGNGVIQPIVAYSGDALAEAVAIEGPIDLPGNSGNAGGASSNASATGQAASAAKSANGNGSSNSNAGGNGKSNAGGNSGSSNSGGNGNGNSGNSNAGGNGNSVGLSVNVGSGNGNSGSDNAGGNGNGNSGSNSAGGNGNGNASTDVSLNVTAPSGVGANVTVSAGSGGVGLGLGLGLGG